MNRRRDKNLRNSYKFKFNWMSLAMTGLLFCVYFRSLIGVIIGNGYNILLLCFILILGLSILIKDGRLKRIKKFDIKYFGLWFIFIVMIVFHKHPSSPVLSYTTLVTAGSIVVAYFFTSCKLNWISSAWKSTAIFVKIHCVATIVFGIFPMLYTNTVYRLYEGETRQEPNGSDCK